MVSTLIESYPDLVRFPWTCIGMLGVGVAVLLGWRMWRTGRSEARWAVVAVVLALLLFVVAMSIWDWLTVQPEMIER